MKRADAVMVLVCLGGCALTKKASPLAIRYFTPAASPTVAAASRDATTAPGPPPQLRLGRVSAAGDVRDKLIYRAGGHEVAFRTHWRWSEDPAAYVERALAHALFEERGVEERLSGPGLTLEVDLVAFEERLAPGPGAHVELTWRLRNDKVVLVQHTVVIDRPIDGNVRDGEVVAGALAAALALGLDKIVAAVLTELEHRQPAATSPP
jgi:ABC-type uncharacterized transport system auxiliary subunit